jgi:PII-like signaling protein
LREEHRLRVLADRVLMRIFWAERDEVTGEYIKNYILKSLMICTSHPIFLE